MDEKIGSIFLDHQTILNGTVNTRLGIHETLHAKNQSDLIQSTPKATYGMIKVLSADKALPGKIGVYSRQIFFDELNSHQLELGLYLVDLQKADLANELLPKGVGEIQSLIDISRKSKYAAESLLNTMQFHKIETELKYDTKFDGKNTGHVYATIPSTDSNGTVLEAVIPLIKSNGTKDPRNFIFLRDQLGLLKQSADDRLLISEKVAEYLPQLLDEPNSEVRRKMIKALREIARRRPGPGEIGYQPITDRSIEDIWNKYRNE